MRPYNSSYDRMNSASEVCPEDITEGMVYWIGDDRVFIWSSMDEAEYDDDGSHALRMTGWPENFAAIKRILRASDAEEIV